jgi:hypothetical protein
MGYTPVGFVFAAQGHSKVIFPVLMVALGAGNALIQSTAIKPS